MTGRLAILAGEGVLPLALASAYGDAVFVSFVPELAAPPGNAGLQARFERLGALFADLRAVGVSEVVMAGAMTRPVLDQRALDVETTALLPRLMAAKSGGDDGLLRAVIDIFEDAGFAVRGAHELLPELVAEAGLLAGPAPDQQDRADIDRARAILQALAPLDVGQAAVVAGGLCLGIETQQGTDYLLRCVAMTPGNLRPGAGVIVKMPKPGQDLRVDMPAIGPDTVDAADEADLAGIVVQAGAVLILDRDKTLAAAQRAGLFLLAE